MLVPHAANGVHARRWPVALVAVLVGWVPLGGGHHALLFISDGASFVLLVVAARAWSGSERRPMPWSWPVVAGITAAVVALGAVSIAYGTLHPLAISNDIRPPSVKLRDGRSNRLDFTVSNGGPAVAHILGITLVGGHGLALTHAQLGGELRSRRAPGAPTRALKPRAVDPGEYLPLFLELSYPACRRSGTNLDLRLSAFDVRLRVAGSERTQRVVLDDPLRVRCRGAG